MCDQVNVDGHNFVICGARQKRQFCTCGRAAFALCDWKMSGKKSGTCDRAICAGHAKQVAAGKHLCPEHQLQYDLWKKRHPSPQGELFTEAA